jgi:hypothetical protein
MKAEQTKCPLCGMHFTSGGYATKKGRHDRSTHHLFPNRFKKYFGGVKGLANRLGLPEDEFKEISLCYECHEEVLMNPIFTTQMISDLGCLMAGKSAKDRIVILFDTMRRGIEEVKKAD